MTEVIELFGGDVRFWIEQEAIHLKAVGSYGDPVELTSEMCQEFATRLLALADLVDE